MSETLSQNPDSSPNTATDWSVLEGDNALLLLEKSCLNFRRRLEIIQKMMGRGRLLENDQWRCRLL